MNNKIIIVVVVVLVIIGGAFFISNKQSKNTEEAKMSQEKAAMMEKDSEAIKKDETPQQEVMEKKEGEAMMNKTDDKMMKSESSRYVEYSKVALDSASSNRRVLFFYASWCPTCIPTDTDLKANISKIPADVTIIRVNYNDPETDQEEKDLAKKYGITYQHTFVQIDNAGKEVTKWNGGKTTELLTKIK